jgi:hypothetical protein
MLPYYRIHAIDDYICNMNSATISWLQSVRNLIHPSREWFHTVPYVATVSIDRVKILADIYVARGPNFLIAVVISVATNQ